MSISGYVRENYKYTIEGANKAPINLDSAVQDAKAIQDLESQSLLVGAEHSQKAKAAPTKSDYGSRDCVDLASSTAESRFNATVTICPKGQEEIQVPCIVQRVYKLHFTLTLNEKLKSQLPSDLDPQKITLQFYEGKTDNNAIYKEDIVFKKSEKIKILADNITGKCIFTPKFRTTKEKDFLYIALRIHEVVIKYLVCDLAVFTNSSQITENYELVLTGNNVQDILENCFWHEDATFITKKAADAAKRKKKEPPPVPPSRKSLHEIVLATEDALAKWKKLLYGKDEYDEENVSQIARTLVSRISKLPVIQETESPPVEALPQAPSPFPSSPDLFANIFDVEIENYGM